MLGKYAQPTEPIKIKKSKLKDLLLGNQSDLISEGGQTSLIEIINQKYLYLQY